MQVKVREGTKKKKKKPFLASSVPNLSLDNLVINPQTPGRELDTNSRLRLQIKLVFCKPREQVGFTNAWVSNQNQLEKVIILLIRLVTRHLYRCTCHCSLVTKESQRKLVKKQTSTESVSLSLSLWGVGITSKCLYFAKEAVTKRSLYIVLL